MDYCVGSISDLELEHILSSLKESELEEVGGREWSRQVW